MTNIIRNINPSPSITREYASISFPLVGRGVGWKWDFFFGGVRVWCSQMNMIPLCSHQVPSDFILLYCQLVANRFSIICTTCMFCGKSSTCNKLYKIYSTQREDNNTLCRLFWEWQMFAHHTYNTRPCVDRFYFKCRVMH